MNNLKVTLIQMNIVWGDITANCKNASGIIDTNPGSDLYILPEMFSTGFATNPNDIADDNNSTLTWMQEKANETGAAICGSVAIRHEDGSCRNRFYFVKPNMGETADSPTLFYDKHHLFTYGKEHLRYTAGEERVIANWKGVRFLLQICYDLRFPCFSRNHGEYDALIYVASWPSSRIEVWKTLIKARAIENQCYVLAVNRTGDDPVCSYCGGTECIDAYGKSISRCNDNTQEAITLTLDMERQETFRKKFPVLMDAD